MGWGGDRRREREICVEIEEIIGGREGGVREEEAADDGSVDGFYFYPACVIYANRCSNPRARETSADCDAQSVFSHLNGKYEVLTFSGNIEFRCG